MNERNLESRFFMKPNRFDFQKCPNLLTSHFPPVGSDDFVYGFTTRVAAWASAPSVVVRIISRHAQGSSALPVRTVSVLVMHFRSGRQFSRLSFLIWSQIPRRKILLVLLLLAKSGTGLSRRRIWFLVRGLPRCGAAKPPKDPGKRVVVGNFEARSFV